MQESAGVREAMLRYYERFAADDRDSFDRLVSREAGLVIGTNWPEWYDDRETWRKQFGGGGEVGIEAGDVRGYEQGSVGWVVDTPSFVLPDGTKIRTRLTGVMLNEDGDWKLVQLHVSVGVPDEELVRLAQRS
jgi:hypothetical protein